MGRSVTPQLSRSVAGADRGEDQTRRMARLLTMSTAELSAVLGGDPATAAPWVEAAAACGMAGAQLQFGRMLLDGTGVPKDQVAALRWFAKATMAGALDAKIRAEAQNMVGRCHELGWGTTVDFGAAVEWYRRAAAANDSWGIYNLGNMLFDGRGIARDHGAAVALYERAARLGHARAMNLLGRCCEEGWGTPRDPVAAADWYRRSAEAGYFRAQYNHGIELLRLGRRHEAAAMFDRAMPEADAPMRARMAALLSQADRISVAQHCGGE